MIELLLLCLASVGLPSVAAPQGVRVVDSVTVAVAADEAAHRLSGERMTTGSIDGKTWRSAAGWFAYTLRIYDDSPLTIVCVLADGEAAGEAFDVLVDGERAARVTREPGRTKGATVEVTLALKITEGKTSVVVKLAALPGSRTARLLELRTVQEHLE